jgi:hypothetical protein
LDLPFDIYEHFATDSLEVPIILNISTTVS